MFCCCGLKFEGPRMAADEEKSNDFYAVLGLKKECSAAELRNAYKNLAMKWHPDRCSASGNSKLVEEAKKKFQAIQAAYSVLSDANKRFLYDVGVYDCDDDEDENGMGDFLNEMAAMMSQNKSSENEESFEDLQELFEEMFQSDIVAFASSSRSATSSTCSSSSLASCGEAHSASNKRNSWEISSNSTKAEQSPLEDSARGQAENQECPRRARGTGAGTSKRRDGRKRKVSFGHDVSSNDYSSVSFS